MAGLARELRGVETHRSPIAFAEGMNGIQLVDVIAEPIEKGVSRKSAEPVLCSDVGEQLIQLARDVGDMREACAAFANIDGAVFPRPMIDVMK